MVVDGGVDVVEADAASGDTAGLAAQASVAATVGEPAAFLHVHVGQFAVPVAFVTANDLSREPVQEDQPVRPDA